MGGAAKGKVVTDRSSVLPYFRAPITEFLGASLERYAADGLPVQEILRAREEVTSWDRWVPHWLGRSQWFEYESRPASVSPASRASLLVNAMLTAHVGQYLHFHDPSTRTLALERKIAMYRAAAPFLDPPADIVTVNHGPSSLPALLRVPPDRSPVPCVIYVGGLDAHKEDAHTFLELCLERGLAVLAFDGPGQGEARLHGATLTPDSHTAISSIIDFITAHPYLDEQRIGVIGRSLGGYLAPRAAADDRRIAALAVWGAMYDLSNFADLPSHTRAGFAFVMGMDKEMPPDALDFIDLSGHASRIRCPTLIVHGELDRLTPPSNAIRLANAIGDPCELRLIPNSPHCNHDLAHVLRPAMADWLARQLRTATWDSEPSATPKENGMVEPGSRPG